MLYMGYFMDQLIRKIRSFAGMSQQEFAGSIGVTFASINRWENGHAQPNRMAQLKLYEFCKEKSVPLNDFIHQKIQAAVANLSPEENRMILYHGSKAGIVGTIAPVSRERCDFGKGFYMGTEPDQSLTLICDFEASRFYIVSLDIEQVRAFSVSDGIDWAMLVAYYRGKMEIARGSRMYEKYSQMLNGYDTVIGSIADDRMFYVLDNFFLGNITDVALVKSLSALQLGKQYVCITQKGCNSVRIEKEIPLSVLERCCLKDISTQNRAKGVTLANEICKKTRREGKYFDEILEEAD